jgi:hypothetical protein
MKEDVRKRVDKDPRQTEIPGSRGDAIQQAITMIRDHAEERASKVFGKTPPCIDTEWYEQLQRAFKDEVALAFTKGVEAGAKTKK